MSTTTKKGELFVKEVIARLKGDDVEAKANKIARKAISALDVQIATLKGKLVEAEVQVETKEEALKNAMYPTEIFTNNQEYCQSIQRAQSNLDEANDYLKDIQESIKFFEGVLKKF